ncbi:MAG: acylphosphatase [Verrucomicrobiota bacterium]
MESEESTFHLNAFFSGHVQGVGFRYSTYQIAKGYEVTGWVKNLMDGRVELDVEGEKQECLQFLRNIEDELDTYIRKTESKEGARGKTYDKFIIA